jgi:hypothetical protein
VQPIARTKDLDLRKLILSCGFQPLRQARWEREGAAIRQLDHHPSTPAVILRCRGARLIVARDAATFRRGVDLDVSQFRHE